MQKILNPEKIFKEITNDYKQVFGNDLVSIILYGSATGRDYHPGKSDLNFLIVLSEEAIDHLDAAIESVARWKKKKVAIPLFMTKSYIESSLDSYPLEFLNIQNNHILVYGEDVLKDLFIEPHHLRLQCEREIKGKTLLLHESLMETEGKPKKIHELIKVSITAFISIFNGLLYLKGIEIPSSKKDIIKAVAGDAQIDPRIFIKCLDIKEGNIKVPSTDLMGIFKSYLSEVRRLWRFVDKMDH